MARLRYVRTLEQVKQARESAAGFLKSTVRSLRVEYETDPAIHRALVPKPLQPTPRPVVCTTFTDIAVHLSPENTMTLGAAIFGVTCSYDGAEGVYLITMPMTTEQSVVPGRETYGEAKKIAQIEFTREGSRVESSVSRLGFTYLSASGRLGAELGPRELTQYGYCFKMFPACDRSRNFDFEPLLIRLNWIQKHSNAWQVEEGQLELGESPLDPVADVPVRALVRFEYEEGSAETNGEVLRSVPEEWVLPISHQRYDDPFSPGVEIAGV